MIRSVSSVTAILLFALVNITILPTTVKAQSSLVVTGSDRYSRGFGIGVKKIFSLLATHDSYGAYIR